MQGSEAGQEPQFPPQPSSPHIFPWHDGWQGPVFFGFFLGFFFFFFFLASTVELATLVMPSALRMDTAT
jgi:hypothetical protein